MDRFSSAQALTRRRRWLSMARLYGESGWKTPL